MSSIEIVDECLVVDICVDRYLWTLYQRTPKEDTIKELERRNVTVKRKGKMVTVARTFTKLVDEDFGWKDPKAAERAGMSMMDYVIGGMDRSFKLKLFHTLHAAEAAGLSPGITSAFRDDYRQSIASGLKAASNRSYHGGSSRGGYGHGLAADIVSVQGETRDQRWASSEKLWKWVDAHGKEFGIGRPYLDRDPPHVAPVDGQEYATHYRGETTRHAASDSKKRKHVATRDDHGAAETREQRKIVEGERDPGQAPRLTAVAIVWCSSPSPDRSTNTMSRIASRPDKKLSPAAACRRGSACVTRPVMIALERAFRLDGDVWSATGRSVVNPTPILAKCCRVPLSSSDFGS